MNKKACRKFADRPLHISANHGLLHAPQIEWLICSAIKIIDHHRTLILYIYSQAAAAQGVFQPRWVVFQTSTDYITLENRDNDSTAWRTTNLERLSDQLDCIKRGAFYSRSDEQRVKRYFKNDTRSGLAGMMDAQETIQARRSAERRRKTQRKIAARMSVVPAVPRGLDRWVRRQMMPTYFLYDYQKGRKTVTGVCTACGKPAKLDNVKHNADGTCTNCKRPLTMKSRGRMGNLKERDTCQVIQRISPDELVIRIFKVYQDHVQSTIALYESARQFIYLKSCGDLSLEEYYAQNNNGQRQWKCGKRPTFSRYQYCFAADNCAHVYCGNLTDALVGTPWQYCPVDVYYAHYREAMELRPFLEAHLSHPRMEHLIKTGFFALTTDIAYHCYNQYTIDETQHRTHRILGVDAEDIPFLRSLDADSSVLHKFAQYRGLKERQSLLNWQLEHGVARDIPQLLQKMTGHKLVRYLHKQQSRLDEQAQKRYRTTQALVSEYRDYLETSEKLGDDLSNSFVLFPADLRKAHDNAARRHKIKVSAELRNNFRIAYQRVISQLDFELDGMKIVYPAGPEEIAREGQALHHCVAGYVDRIAKKECLILFLRRSDDLSVPFYTVEVRERRAVQVRGMGNAEATHEVEKFVAQWEKRVLQTAA